MFDLWYYRESVGWWLEEELLDNHRAVDRAITVFRREHKTADWTKIVLMVVPSGKKNRPITLL